jgi:hypothetical protein
MSKHERQHSVSHVINTRIAETKRVRVENTNAMNIDVEENVKLNDAQTVFSTCFLTEKILMPDNRQSIE